MSLQERVDRWLERLHEWRKKPLKSIFGGALLVVYLIYPAIWAAALFGVWLIASDVWERSPIGKRAALKKRLKELNKDLDGKSTEGLTVGQFTFLYCAVWAFVLYSGGPSGFASEFVSAWSDVFPKLQAKQRGVELFTWIGLATVGAFVAFLWILRLLGYIEKEDRVID
jgi:hypothetical protein